MKTDSIELPPVRDGDLFIPDHAFIATAILETRRLVNRCGLKDNDVILDIGCGYGRLAVGLLYKQVNVCYAGLDVRQSAVDWCRKVLKPQGRGSLSFYHLDVHNERYNPQGKLIDRDFRFPLADRAFDIVYAFSLFSHMLDSTAEIYFREMSRVIRPGGVAFLTAFTRVKGPNFAVNPDDFDTVLSRDTPLHFCVYKQSYLEHMLARNDFAKIGRRSRLPQSTQSAYYFRRNDDK